MPRRGGWKKRGLILLVLGGGTLVILNFFDSTYRYFSVCRGCGLRQETTEYQFPGLMMHFLGLGDLSYWTTHETMETPLSTALTGSLGFHRHQWVFGYGRGNGVT